MDEKVRVTNCVLYKVSHEDLARTVSLNLNTVISYQPS